MKRLGIVLMIVGFFLAALVSVRHTDGAGRGWQTIEWSYYAAAFVVGVIGVVLIRVAASRVSSHEEKVATDISKLNESVNLLQNRLALALAEREQRNVYDIHGWIDSELELPISDFVEARESMIPLYGLQSYADIMTQFAGGERAINRAWSASADGYIDEVWTCLDRAKAMMDTAAALLAARNTAQNDPGAAPIPV